jgi:hypothetical protein
MRERIRRFLRPTLRRPFPRRLAAITPLLVRKYWCVRSLLGNCVVCTRIIRDKQRRTTDAAPNPSPKTEGITRVTRGVVPILDGGGLRAGPAGCPFFTCTVYFLFFRETATAAAGQVR